MAIQDKSLRCWADETVKVSKQWAAEAESRGTSVSSSSWSYSGSGTLSSQTLSSNLSSVTLAATSSGVLSNAVILADGEVLVSKREVLVLNS